MCVYGRFQLQWLMLAVRKMLLAIEKEGMKERRREHLSV